MPNSAHSSLLDSQDDRITRLETTVSEVAVSSAEIKVKQDYLAKTLDEQTERLSGDIAKVGQAVENLATSWAKTEQELVSKLAPLQEDFKRREETRGWFKKLGVPLVLAGGGVLATKLGELLWVWLSHGQ